jgi:low affinity Fe/Cu permease
MGKQLEGLGRQIERVSLWATEWSGRTDAILASVIICVLWAAAGPFLHFSDTWQLIINTLTSLVTFVMVFLIQRASNRLIAVEELSEDELRRLHERYQQLVELTQQDPRRKAAYSVEAIDQQVAEAEPQPRPARPPD